MSDLKSVTRFAVRTVFANDRARRRVNEGLVWISRPAAAGRTRYRLGLVIVSLAALWATRNNRCDNQPRYPPGAPHARGMPRNTLSDEPNDSSVGGVPVSKHKYGKTQDAMEMSMRTKDELRQVLATTFGLAPMFDNDGRHVDLVTPTGISIVRMDVLNRGTDDAPEWGIGGVGALGATDSTDRLGGFGWQDLMKL